MKKDLAWLEEQCDNIKKAEFSRLGSVKQDLTAYKFVRYTNANDDSWVEHGAIAKLIIPAGTRIHWSTINQKKVGKCRAAKAIVLDIKKRKRNISIPMAVSHWDTSFQYHIGDVVEPRRSHGNKVFFSTSHQTCAAGIHFFLTLKEVEDYVNGY